MKKELYTEVVTDRIGRHILASKIHKSTISEIKQAIKKNGDKVVKIKIEYPI